MAAADDAISQVPPEGWPEMEMMLFIERAAMLEQDGLRWCAVADLRAARMLAATGYYRIALQEGFLVDLIADQCSTSQMSARPSSGR
jgi:hypothetical protein